MGLLNALYSLPTLLYLNYIGFGSSKCGSQNMSEKKKRIAIIGGGFSGAGSIIMLKEENMDPVCFEKTDKLGGTWCYREDIIDGVASIMPTTIINNSKEMGGFSTFPPPKEYPNYMRHWQLYEYFKMYCEKYDCMKHIQFNMEVIEVKRTEDYDQTGRWRVTAKNTVTGEEFTDEFDGVMVCVGHINRPQIPDFPGLNKFKGKVMHTHSLKDVSEFKDQRVLVVGTGCSALDAAVETSSVAEQIYMSTRTGAYVLGRLGPFGYPVDTVFLRRFVANLMDILPTNFCSYFLEKSLIDSKFHHTLYAVPPKYHVLSKDPIVSDYIGAKLLSGSVIQQNDIDEFTEDGVIFKGEDRVTKVDKVIMATGYTWDFPFLEKGIVTEKDGKINLYKLMYPPHLKHPTLAIIGFILPFGPGMPLGELQCRWAAHIFAGKGSLPSKEIMLKDINRRHNMNKRRYAPSEKMTLRVDYVQYMDEIASRFGVKPNLLKLFFTDIKLFWKLYWGPCYPYQYRLQGPHSWEGARDAIMKAEERILFPLRAKNCKSK
ncbi:flavin-containing monooxygenase 5-like isoform X2 [Stegodyphus dumicola]|uniref:flavin-containing monooxygenase 5-like isoform X2 n=1 Tax=Stegodyphus dumicola TaxID=202533 RepID=UPI0015AF2052|nr:flavin-containing monooxygenase 5-like isoform X2 [Stegodyphus dumicola]